MKILILANCQHVGLSACVRALLPGAEVESVDLGGVAASADYDELAIYDRAHSADLVITQPVEQPRFGRLTSASLTKTIGRVQLVPAIAIDAYHPDCIYIDGGGQHLKGPMGDYHSLIIAAAFAAGYRQERVPMLFNAYTYATLGFFNRMSSSISFIEQLGSNVGMDLSDQIGEWRRPGAFMYTVNHPAIRVLLSLTRAALTQAKIPYENISGDDIEDDLASRSRWPVYPEIARRLDCPEEPIAFRLNPRSGHEVMSLSEFIDKSYERYASLGEKLHADTRIVSASKTLLQNTSRWSSDKHKTKEDEIIISLYKGIGQEPDPQGVEYWSEMTTKNGIETTIEMFVGNIVHNLRRSTGREPKA